MDLTVESRLADGTLADRTPLRFEWAGTAVADAKPKAHSVPQLDADDLAALLKRGDELMASGDLAAARLVLQRAADAGDARAAWTLAGTYDPVVLEKLRVHGLAPNVAKARSWYERAKQLGEPRQLVDVSE
jgi:TPR repeat protein